MCFSSLIINLELADECPRDRYGIQCEFPCMCYNGGTCERLTGQCICPDGFTGPSCLSRCPQGSYGTDCGNKCQCQNNGTCDHITGACTCPPGYRGPYCQQGINLWDFWTCLWFINLVNFCM